MSTEPFIGEIKLFGFNFAPRGYMLCQGQLLPISSYAALFSLLGTTYGGNGMSTFGLPDLRGRMPIGQGQGPGLPNYAMGEVGGTTQTSILTSNMPAHTHPAQGIQVKIPVSNSQAEEPAPANGYLAVTTAEVYASAPSPGAFYGNINVEGTTGISGANVPLNIQNPFLTMNYSIALEGIFPSRP